jgi:membrane protease YdiL (CAAX protease family)
MISKKKYDLDLPYTYGEKSAFDLFAWFKILTVSIFAFFSLIFFFPDLLHLLFKDSPWILQKYTAEFTIFSGVLFLLLNIAGLEWSAKRNWRLLFRKVMLKDWKIIIGFTALTFVASYFDATFFKWAFGAPVVNHMDTANLSTLIINLIEGLFQLFGEEFIAIIPFLAFVSLGKRFKLNQTFVLTAAVILSSIVFGMAHTWTYGGLIHGIIGVGISRIAITMSYVKTKNLWVSYIVHYLFDAIGLVLYFAALALK